MKSLVQLTTARKGPLSRDDRLTTSLNEFTCFAHKQKMGCVRAGKGFGGHSYAGPLRGDMKPGPVKKCGPRHINTLITPWL
jgi:hypothetical protein